MRIIITFLLLLIGFSSLDAQITVVPLESNQVLQKHAAEAETERIQRFERFYGAEVNTPRALDCNNDDGAYFSGETIYLVSGDSIELCFVINAIDTLFDVSFNLTSGTTTLNEDSTCVTYFSDLGVTLNLTDTIRINKCDTLEDCLEFFYPVVVKRADESIIMPAMELQQEEEIEVCTPTLNLPGEVYGTSFIDCSDTPMLGEVFNVNFQDSCFIYVASRFAEPDEICFEICDEYCICDTYTYTFTTEVDGIDYPFMDDFSYRGPHPNTRNWLDDNVFVNTTMTYLPPSVGVATFDGIDETGTPYGSGIGRADYLTSNYFNLNTSDTDLWLSFWLQNKGITYGSNPGDTFEVEFKDDNGDWITVLTKDGFDYSLLERDTFKFYKIALDNDDDNFLHDNFQFRFVNRAGLSSMNDTWHLDYVVLDENEPDSTFEDLAFASLPSDILERYSSMPWWQFEGFAEMELNDTTVATFVNHFADDEAQPQSSRVTHKGIQSGVSTDIGDFFTVIEPADIMIQPGERFVMERELPSVSDFANDLVTTYGGTNEKLSIERKYTYTSSPTQVGIEDVLRNDTVVLSTVFDNYYAYDDGTAEAAVRLNIGHEVAIAFSSNVDDSLRAVQFRFPRIGPQSPNALFNLKVYIGELNSDSEPAFVRNLIKPFFVDQVLDSLQGFTTYRLRNSSGQLTPLFIPAGDFYVAWEQASSNESRVYVGLDYNTPEAQPYQFFNNNVDWFSIPDEGALMVRPVMGEVTPTETRVNDLPELSDWMQIYPNPASNQLHFELKQGSNVDYKVELLTTTGQLVHNNTLSNTIDISQLSQGMYFVKVTQLETNKVLTQRLVVVK